jgi:phosphatidylinositol glycan class V
MSNIPLFLLALPMLSVLVMTGIVASGLSSQKHAQYSKRTAVYIFCLALPQVVLALLAFTTFHVQIINRIATGYPIWYIVLAHAMVYPGPVSANEKTVSSVSSSSWMTQIRGYLCNPTTQQLIFRGMFMYSIIQGGLYASFMPPA